MRVRIATIICGVAYYMTNMLTTSEKGRMYRLALKPNGYTPKLFISFGSGDIVGLRGRRYERIDSRTMRNGSLCFQGTLRPCGPQIGGRCVLRESYSSRRAEVQSR